MSFKNTKNETAETKNPPVAKVRVGLITGSILVFIPLMGEYVIPSLLGLGKVFLIGNVLQLDFLGSRNWPAGSAKAVALIVIMLITVTFYLWSTNRGRATRDVSVL